MPPGIVEIHVVSGLPNPFRTGKLVRPPRVPEVPHPKRIPCNLRLEIPSLHPIASSLRG